MPDDTTRLTAPNPSGDATQPPLAQTQASDGSHDSVPEPQPEAPPGYDLLEEIGHGGMGVVYRAHDRALNRIVAIKFLRRAYPVESVEGQRFLKEAQITSQLQHPGIPPVHLVGTLTDGRPFIVMKLIVGNTLQSRIKQCQTATDRARLLPVFERICQAVGLAHSHRVIHRDLKPANIMVGAFGEVQVMDWGLARSLDDNREVVVLTGATAPDSVEVSNSVTETGSVLGTPAYMPPEQAMGEHDHVDERSDVFGLGAVLCAILTGEPPYVGPDPASIALQAIQGQLKGAFARMEKCGADPDLLSLCRRCLAPEQKDRPHDANELAEVVGELRAKSEERARLAEVERVRAEAAYREQRQRRRVRASLIGSTMLLLLLGAAVFWWIERQAAQQDAEDLARLAQNAGTIVALLDECEVALRAENASSAAVIFTQAEKRFAEGGADHLVERLARCRADLNLLNDLDRIDNRHWTVIGGKTRGARPAAAELPAVFARYGIVPGKMPQTQVIARIDESFIRDRILTALDRWLEWSRAPDILAILRAVDPDTFRNAMREAVAAANKDRIKQLASQSDALAQPPRYAATFGEAELPASRRSELILAALKRRPGDHRLLVTMGYLTMIADPGKPLEYEKWFRASIAIRPTNPVARNYLGLAMLNKGLIHEAIAEFQESILQEPTYAGAYNNLGAAFDRLNDPVSAIAAFRKAIECAPDYMLAHANLGTFLEHAGDLEGAVKHYGEWVRLDPRGSLGLRRLAWILATAPIDSLRNGHRAVELARRACEMTKENDPECLDALAAAEAEVGDFARAIANENRALSFSAFEKQNGAAARCRLSRYERKMPCRTRTLAPPPHEMKK